MRALLLLYFAKTIYSRRIIGVSKLAGFTIFANDDITTDTPYQTLCDKINEIFLATNENKGQARHGQL